MNKEVLQNMYGSTPESFKSRVDRALREEPVRRAPRLRVALIAALIAVLLAAVAVAAFSSRVAEVFGWFYGAEMQERLMTGELAISGQSVAAGRAVYTLEEVIHIQNGLYAVGTIHPAEGANVVLLPEDETAQSPAGYSTHTGDPIPEDAPSYQQKADAAGATLLVVKCAADRIGLDEGSMDTISAEGYWHTPQPDGGVQFAFELGIGEQNADEYTLSLWCSQWELESDESYLGQEWLVTVKPEKQREGKTEQ